MSNKHFIDKLDGLRLSNALRAGIYCVFSKTDYINKINVFPVPDGDTGTNISMTFSSVLSALDLEKQPHAGNLLVRVSDAALDGARGNSGAILAQFFMGMSDSAENIAQLDLQEFTRCVQNGAIYAHDAISKPREGTLITVINEFARVAQELAISSEDFQSFFFNSLIEVRKALELTKTQLEELRAANVVDAGALGFVVLLEGILNYLKTGDIGRVILPFKKDEDFMPYDNILALNQDFRFCSECLILAPVDKEINLRQLREYLASKGSSLVVSGSKRKARVHIHTNEPESIFNSVSKFGEVSNQKADDMYSQQSALRHKKSQKVVVVTDSAADIPEELIDHLGIHIVPARIHFGSHSYLDKVSMTPTEFYNELASNVQHPKTSQPPPGDFRRIYEFLISHYEAVVSISLSSKVSGCYNAAHNAAKRINYQGKSVTVIDSLSASLGQALITISAAQAAQAGASAAEVIAIAEEAIGRSYIYALLKNVDYAVKGGRIPKIARTLAKIFNLSIILQASSDGRVNVTSVLWGKYNLRHRFALYVQRRMKQMVTQSHFKILIAHGNVLEQAQLLADDIKKLINPEKLEFIGITDCGPALGVHGGPGILIVGVQRSIN